MAKVMLTARKSRMKPVTVKISQKYVTMLSIHLETRLRKIKGKVTPVHLEKKPLK